MTRPIRPLLPTRSCLPRGRILLEGDAAQDAVPEIHISLFGIVGRDAPLWIPVPVKDRLINIPHLVGLAKGRPKSCPQEEAISHVYSGHVCPKEEGILGRSRHGLSLHPRSSCCRGT